MSGGFTRAQIPLLGMTTSANRSEKPGFLRWYFD